MTVSILTNNFSKDDSSKILLEEIVNGSVELLRDITHLRTEINPILELYSPAFSTDVANEAIWRYYKTTPRYVIRNTKSDKRITFIPSPFSYRRFEARIDDKTYILRTFSPRHPPSRSLTTFTSYAPTLPSMPPAVLESEIGRSLSLHSHLMDNGIPFHNTPVAFLEFMSNAPEQFYGIDSNEEKLVIPAHTPFSISITEQKTEAIRLSFLTPQLMKELADVKEISPKEYMEYIFSSVGSILNQLNFFQGRDDTAILTAHDIPKSYFNKKYSVDFGMNGFSGEFHPHNISMDLRTGDVALVDDLSYAFPISISKGKINFKVPFQSVEVHEVSKTELELARIMPYEKFIYDTLYSRPLIHCIHEAGIISKEDFFSHLSAIESYADLLLKNKSEYGKRLEDRQILALSLVEEFFPFFDMNLKNAPNFSFFYPSSEKGRITVNAEKVLAVMKKESRLVQMRGDNEGYNRSFLNVRGMIEGYNNLLTLIESTEKDYSPEYEAFAIETGKRQERILEGRVSETISTLLMNGYGINHAERLSAFDKRDLDIYQR